MTEEDREERIEFDRRSKFTFETNKESEFAKKWIPEEDNKMEKFLNMMRKKLRKEAPQKETNQKPRKEVEKNSLPSFFTLDEDDKESSNTTFGRKKKPPKEKYALEKDEEYLEHEKEVLSLLGDDDDTPQSPKEEPSPFNNFNSPMTFNVNDNINNQENDLQKQMLNKQNELKFFEYLYSQMMIQQMMFHNNPNMKPTPQMMNLNMMLRGMNPQQAQSFAFFMQQQQFKQNQLFLKQQQEQIRRQNESLKLQKEKLSPKKVVKDDANVISLEDLEKGLLPQEEKPTKKKKKTKKLKTKTSIKSKKENDLGNPNKDGFMGGKPLKILQKTPKVIKSEVNEKVANEKIEMENVKEGKQMEGNIHKGIRDHDIFGKNLQNKRFNDKGSFNSPKNFKYRNQNDHRSYGYRQDEGNNHNLEGNEHSNMMRRKKKTLYNTYMPKLIQDYCYSTISSSEQSETFKASKYMSKWNIAFVARAQMRDLIVENPLLDDYYFTTYISKKTGRLPFHYKERCLDALIKQQKEEEVKIYESTLFGRIPSQTINTPRKMLHIDSLTNFSCVKEEGKGSLEEKRWISLCIENGLSLCITLKEYDTSKPLIDKNKNIITRLNTDQFNEMAIAVLRHILGNVNEVVNLLKKRNAKVGKLDNSLKKLKFVLRRKKGRMLVERALYHLPDEMASILVQRLRDLFEFDEFKEGDDYETIRTMVENAD